MAMTTERENLLVTYLAADEARTKALFEMSAEEAVAKINADGYDFTAEDIQELGTKLVTIAESSEGELSEDTLENVAGGFISAILAMLANRIKSKRTNNFTSGGGNGGGGGSCGGR